MFLDPYIIVKSIKKSATRCSNVSKFYYSVFIWSSTCFGRHTSHHQEPKTALAASVFHTWKVVGRCQAQCAWQRPPATRPSTFHGIMKNRGCQCSFRLLMMGGVSPETCWASYKYGIMKFWYNVVPCWIFLYELLSFYVFHVIIISTTDSICKQHQPVAICGGEAACFLCWRNLIFMYYLDITYASMCRQVTVLWLVKKLPSFYKTARFIFLE
jgi:hypothetical protein